MDHHHRDRQQAEGKPPGSALHRPRAANQSEDLGKASDQHGADDDHDGFEPRERRQAK